MSHNLFRSFFRTTITLFVAVAFVIGLLPVRAVTAQNTINDAALTGFTANGLDSATLSWSGGSGSFTVNIYQSVDMVVDGSDVLLGTVTVTDASALSQDYFIGTGPGQMPFPISEIPEDYYLLAQVQDASLSTLQFIGVYYVPTVKLASGTKIAPFVFPGGGNAGFSQQTGSGIEVASFVFLHGVEGVDTVTFNIKVLQWDAAGTPHSYDYSAYKVFGFSLHLHGGNDVASASQISLTAMFGGAGDDVLNPVLSLVSVYEDGGSGNDILNGSNQDDSLNGGDGNDTLVGGLGNDSLDGGPGDDFLRGGKGDDTLIGGGGNDTASFSSATTGVLCDLRGQPGAICTGDGTDTLTGIRNLIGGPYNDALTGDNFDNVLVGGLGNDTLYGMDGNDTLDGGEGNDKLYGGNGDDILMGGRGNNQLIGEAGNDTLGGSFGNDIIDCSTGNQDWVNYDSPAAVTFDLRITGPQNTIGQGTDTVRNCENIIGSPFNDILTGNDSPNQIRGLAGDDTIYGWGGADTLDGGPDTNVLYGGAGVNTVTYELANGPVNVDLVAGTGSGGVAPKLRSDTFPSNDIQNIIGSTYDDSLFGDDKNNVIDGDGGSDQMDGRGGTDTVTFASYTEGVNASLTLGTAVGLGDSAFTSTLANFENVTGSAFDDIIEGDCGNNVLDGGIGTDLVTFEHQDSCLSAQAALDENGINAIDGVNVSLQGQTATGRGTDTVKNFENLTGTIKDDILNGSLGPNVIHGLSGKDKLIGNSGDDTLYGDEGNDTLIGDRGNDTIDGGDGTDMVSYLTAGSGVNVDLSINTTINDGWGTTDTIVNCENLEGTNYPDRLVGNDNVNSIWGYGGNDVIIGLAGADQLYGGSGNDTLSAYLEGVSSSDGAADFIDGGSGTGDVAYYFPVEDLAVGIP